MRGRHHRESVTMLTAPAAGHFPKKTFYWVATRNAKCAFLLLLVQAGRVDAVIECRQALVCMRLAALPTRKRFKVLFLASEVVSDLH